MEDYIEFLQKYKILIVVYILAFILILYFIWRPEREEETSLFNVSSVTEETAQQRYFNYYKNKLDEIFLEANYSDIYNNYLLSDYKTKNSITEENVEQVIKYKCESFRNAKTTSYTVNKSGDTVIYSVSFINDNSANTLNIYELTPYNFKLAFGSDVYGTIADTSNNTPTVSKSEFYEYTKDGIKFEILRVAQRENFIEYNVKVTNVSSMPVNVNLIQNNNLVLIDSDGNYYPSSISKNDSFKLEENNYTEFTAGFKVNIANQSKIKYMRFTKIEKNDEVNQIDLEI